MRKYRSVYRERLDKKKWHTERTEESQQENREMQHKVKVEVSKDQTNGVQQFVGQVGQY